MILYLLATPIFLPRVTIREIFTFKHTNVLDSFNLNMKGEDVDDLDENLQANLFCQCAYMPKSGLLGSSVCFR